LNYRYNIWSLLVSRIMNGTTAVWAVAPHSPVFSRCNTMTSF